MQQQEALSARGWPVPSIQPVDAFLSCGQEFFVALYVLVRRVSPV